MKFGRRLLLVLSSLCVAIAHSRKIDDCIGWTPEECSSHHGCRTCYDGTRLECYPDGLMPTLQTYGASSCPSALCGAPDGTALGSDPGAFVSVPCT